MGSTLFGLIGFALTIYAWVWAAKKSKNKGRGFLKRHLAGLGAFIAANVILAIIAGILFPASDNDRPADNQSVTSNDPTPAPEETSSAPADVADTESQSEQSADVSELYTVESDDYLGDVKRTVEVTLDHRITESELTQIAKIIRADQRRDTSRTFISYLLAEQHGGGIYWATTHYNPDLDVQILGTTIEQQGEIEANDTGPEQFSSVKAMFEAFQDYPPERKENFEQLGVDPIHIRVSADEFANTPGDVIHDDNWRAAIYGIYNTFIHTSAERVIVDAIPVHYKGLMDRDNPRMLSDRKITLDMTRDQATDAVNALTRIDSIADVKEPTQYGYQWTGSFQNFYYDDLNVFISVLRPYCEGSCS